MCVLNISKYYILNIIKYYLKNSLKLYIDIIKYFTTFMISHSNVTYNILKKKKNNNIIKNNNISILNFISEIIECTCSKRYYTVSNNRYSRILS